MDQTGEDAFAYQRETLGIPIGGCQHISPTVPAQRLYMHFYDCRGEISTHTQTHYNLHTKNSQDLHIFLTIKRRSKTKSYEDQSKTLAGAGEREGKEDTKGKILSLARKLGVGDTGKEANFVLLLGVQTAKNGDTGGEEWSITLY